MYITASYAYLVTCSINKQAIWIPLHSRLLSSWSVAFYFQIPLAWPWPWTLKLFLSVTSWRWYRREHFHCRHHPRPILRIGGNPHLHRQYKKNPQWLSHNQWHHAHRYVSIIFYHASWLVCLCTHTLLFMILDWYISADFKKLCAYYFHYYYYYYIILAAMRCLNADFP